MGDSRRRGDFKSAKFKDGTPPRGCTDSKKKRKITKGLLRDAKFLTERDSLELLDDMLE